MSALVTEQGEVRESARGEAEKVRDNKIAGGSRENWCGLPRECTSASESNLHSAPLSESEYRGCSHGAGTLSHNTLTHYSIKSFKWIKFWSIILIKINWNIEENLICSNNESKLFVSIHLFQLTCEILIQGNSVYLSLFDAIVFTQKQKPPMCKPTW